MSSPHALSALLAGTRTRPRVVPAAAAAAADVERESGSDSGLEDAPPRRPASLPSTRVCPVPTTTAAPVSDPARLRGFAEQADERVGEGTGGEQLEVLYREAVKRAQEQRSASPETPRKDEESSPEPSAKATPAGWSERTWGVDNRRDAASKPPLRSSAGRFHTGTSSSGMRVSSHSKPWRSLLDLGSWDDSGVDTPPAVRRVLQLWQGFRLDDYAAFHGRPEPRPKPRSASCARSPKVTIPKPFSLVQRDVEREAARGTRRRRLAEELAQLALERRQREEAECAVRVRAAPVPARSLLPLYHELRERAQRRSLDNRAARKEELRASLKPFEFAEREENKREEERVRPRHNLEKEVPSKSRRVGSAERPALRAVLDPSVSERLAADELLRRVRAGMRAQELLEKAAIPPGLHAHIAEQARGRSRTAPVATRCSEPSFRPRVHHSVPDFQRLLRDFQRSSLSRSAPPPPAACAPFALRTTERGEKRVAAATASAGRDARPRAFRSNPCPAAADWIPTRSNDAARRRHESIRSRALEGRERKERDEEERAKTRREREKAMRADLLRRARANDPHRSLAESHPGKLRQIKEQDKKRTHEYSTELQAMKDRVARRPLLLEQVTQRNAKRQAERRYREALRETGMDEEFVRELGSGAAGGETAGPADEDGDDDDDDDGVDGASDTGMTGGVPDSGGRGDSQDSRPLQNSRDDESEDVKESQESDEGDFEEHREEGDKEDASEGEDDADERQ